MILGYNVRPAGKAGEAAVREGVDIRYYTVIYQAIDEIEAALKGMLKPEFEEVQLGTAEVREVFRVPRVGNVAGALVRSEPSVATARRGLFAMASSSPTTSWWTRLKRFKDDATEVREGFECGIGLGSYNDIKIGDVIETFELREKPRTLTERVDCRPESATHQARARRRDGWWSGPWWSICGSATCAR